MWNFIAKIGSFSRFSTSTKRDFLHFKKIKIVLLTLDDDVCAWLCCSLVVLLSILSILTPGYLLFLPVSPQPHPPKKNIDKILSFFNKEVFYSVNSTSVPNFLLNFINFLYQKMKKKAYSMVDLNAFIWETNFFQLFFVWISGLSSQDLPW